MSTLRFTESSRSAIVTAVDVLLGTVLLAQTPATQIRFTPQVIAQNLQTVWALAFAPDGRLFLTERGGRIRVIQKDRLLPEPWGHDSCPRVIRDRC